MKKKIIMAFALSMCTVALFTGCGNSGSADTQAKEITYTVPSDFSPLFYSSEEELPENAFYIVHDTTDENGNPIKRYFPLHDAEKSFDKAVTSPQGADANRIVWVNYNIDEGLIPTMYPGDIMIYKSSSSIPVVFQLEKFYDEGYTFGVAGLSQDLSGNYRYSSDNGSIVMYTSDAVGFEDLEAESIYFVSAEDMRISPSCISPSGTVMGLELMKQYNCDIRTGTEKISALLTANVHYFSSAENYLFGSFSFITEHIAQINIPEYAQTGYYSINGSGIYRYLKNETEYESLKESDYNRTIYAYEDTYNNKKITGTITGLVFDENGFLVEPTETTAEQVEKQENTSVRDIMENISSQYQTKTGVVTAVSEPVACEDGVYYDLQVEELLVRLYMNNSSVTEVPVVGETCLITYTESTHSDYNGNEVFTIDTIQ